MDPPVLQELPAGIGYNAALRASYEAVVRGSGCRGPRCAVSIAAGILRHLERSRGLEIERREAYPFPIETSTLDPRLERALERLCQDSHQMTGG